MGGVVVVGGGHAGLQTVASLRAGGYRGGATVVCAEPHAPYDRPSLSKEMLAGGTDPAAIAMRPRSFFDDRQIALLHDPVVGIDRVRRLLQLAGGRRLGYDHLVLATGATPRRLPVPGSGLSGVIELRSLDDALALRASLARARQAVVVGGGFIGLEVASAASARGIDVAVLERGERLLGRAVTPQVSEAVAAHHVAQGARLCLGESVTTLIGRYGCVTGVVTGSGQLLPADLVVVGVGAVPETGLAARAGLDTADGVVVDGWLTTSDPRISAIGDCATVRDPATGTTRRLESVQNATDQGRYVAARILGETTSPYTAVPWFWSNQGSLKLQMVKLGPEPDRLVRRGGPHRFSVLGFRDGLLTAVESVNDPGTHLAARRLLERVVPLEAELVDADHDLRAVARRVVAGESAVAGPAPGPPAPRPG
ncbi:MAG: NAD(P)/FAD-dependent oxidoreductase, partial [Pseudonocardia sp.]